MHARDANGRQVSLLNDDSGSSSSGSGGGSSSSQMASMQSRGSWPYPSRPLLHHYHHYQQAAQRSGSSTPSTTPELLRSNSYDSQMSIDPTSPLTPSVEFQSYTNRPPAWSFSSSSSSTAAATTAATATTARPEYGLEGPPSKQLAYSHNPHRSRAASYEDDSAPSPAPDRAPDRAGKRYHCRYRDSHGCEKTFTTSGHASRHSKIHTAEKAVQCKFEGCQKKFTRADNMKQHLETHFKSNPKSRSSPHTQRVGLARSLAASASHSPRASAAATGGRRRACTTGRAGLVGPRFGSGQDGYPLPPLAGVGGGLWLPALNQPSKVGAQSGLDTLALAVERYQSDLHDEGTRDDR
ncbi:Transcriptional regulator NRG1 [Escovopsis weberi]|uniref:Transcriptional regulator NRG1 n=1 Tax=Escovopsis weberi TaxID=150374 RepID=A0A0M8N681_ESCWE|nr:Transcriptional regulator NRG1 [Escovopsis weberi]